MKYTDWDLESPGCRNMRSALRRAAALYGERNAYEWKTETGVAAVTYKRLCRESEALGAALLHAGAQGAHIAVCGANSYQWALSYLTVMGLGVAVPVSGMETAESLAYLCAKGDVTLALCDDAVAPLFPAGVKTIGFSSGLEALLTAGEALLDSGDDCYAQRVIDDDAMCEILFTSGTTGLRRGVMLSHRNLMSIVTCDFPYLIGGRSLAVLPFSHGFEAVCHLLVAPLPGVTLCLAHSPRRFAQDLGDFNVTSAYIVPLQAEALLGPFAGELERAKELHTLVCGGAPVSPALAGAYQARGVRLLVGYGLSECSPLVTLNTNNAPGSVGRAAEYCSVRIAQPDAEGNGEVETTGANVMSGYYHDAADTAAAFTDDGWLRTGDIGRLDGEGNLYLTGRKKNLIILSSGENIMPEELESLLAARLPRDAEIRVSEERGALLCEGYGGETPDFEGVLRQAVSSVNALVPPYKRIARVAVLADPMEKTALGKIVRR
jgi:long-chain acyl-CoA synthetase